MKKFLFFSTKTIILIALFFTLINISAQTTVSYTFAGTSGTIDSNVSFTTAQNSAGSAPYYGSELRLYYSATGTGCSLTLTPASGITITDVKIYAVSGNTPTVKYNIDGGADATATLSGTNYTISSVSASSSLRFRNANTTNTKLYTTSIDVTYASSCTTPATPSKTITKTTNCGNTDLKYTYATGEPGTGVSYYWQTSATGTSTTNLVTSGANYNVTNAAATTYYVRAKSGTCWSAATAGVSVTNVFSPNISTQPTNKISTVGSTATFSVTATNVLSYQWQLNSGGGFNDISGATSSSYVTPSTTPAMNGYLYRVVLTGNSPCGNVTSNSATLTVQNTIATDYFQTKSSGNWSDVSSWQSSHTGTGGWVNADLYPGTNASGVSVLASHNILINVPTIVITKTKVFGILTVESSNYSINGTLNGIELSIENGGILKVGGDGYPDTGNAYGLIKTGGKLISANGASATDFTENYIDNVLSSFYYGNQSICEWDNTSGYPATNGYDSFFTPYNSGDMAIFIIKNIPSGQVFGNSANNNYVNAILEINSVNTFNIQATAATTKTKTFAGGIQGTGNLYQQTGGGNNFLILGDGTNIPVIGGTVTLDVQSAGLRLPNGANVPVAANVKITGAAQNNSINRQGGNFQIDGILDLTFMRITNTASGGVVVNGTLRTSNTGGLYGTSSAIPSGTLTLNNNSTIDYYATADQNISSTPNYFNITFSGAGKKIFGGVISVADYGLVKITGTPTVDATSNLYSISGNHTAFTMDGGRLILRKGSTQPLMEGIYNLSGGIVEFADTTAKTIRSPKNYQNIEVTGSDVGNSYGNITLNSGGTFKVKKTGVSSGGTFEINDKTITCPTADCSVLVEDYAVFKTGNNKGFSGFTSAFLDNSAINSNITNISLEANSTVEYKGGNQDVSKSVLTSPTDANYQNLRISGTGVKTANGITVVKNKTYVDASELMIAATLDSNLPNEFHANNGVEVNAVATFRLANNANLFQSSTSPSINIGKATAERIAKLKFVDIATQADYNYWSSPVENQKLLFDGGTASFSPGTPNNRIFRYNEPSDTFLPTSDANFVAGKGYAIRAENAQNGSIYTADGNAKTFSFIGKPNNGDIFTPALTYKDAAHGYNVIGNPYPSNISFTEFHSLNNTFIDYAAYFWTNVLANYQQNQGGSSYSGYNYAVLNGLGGIPATNSTVEPTEFIKPGQGFMIQMKSAGTLKFTNDMRKSGISPFFNNKNSSEKSRFWIRQTSPSNNFNTILIGYATGATDSFDKDFDTPLPGSASDEFYSNLNTQKLAIQAKDNSFSINDIVPLGAKYFENGNYKIDLVKKDGLFTSQAIYLKDKLLNIITNLSEKSYEFAVTSGVLENRFEIVYQPETVLVTAETSANQLDIYKAVDQFVIRSLKQKIIDVEVYDASGRLLLNLKPMATEANFLANKLGSGIFILKIKLGNGEILTRKVRN